MLGLIPRIELLVLLLGHYTFLSHCLNQPVQNRGTCYHPELGSFNETDVIYMRWDCSTQATTHTCQANGTWKPSIGDPCKKTKKCNHPSKSITTKYDVNDEITMPVICNDDSTGTNSSESIKNSKHVCQRDGQWKPSYVDPCTPRCACAPPPEYPNAQLEILKRMCPMEETKAIYGCQSDMKGGGILVCKGGQWKGGPIQCKARNNSRGNTGTALQQSCYLHDLTQKIPPEVSLVAANRSIYRPKERVQLRCDNKNKIKGPKKVKCIHGRWEYTGKSRRQVPRCH